MVCRKFVHVLSLLASLPSCVSICITYMFACSNRTDTQTTHTQAGKQAIHTQRRTACNLIIYLHIWQSYLSIHRSIFSFFMFSLLFISRVSFTYVSICITYMFACSNRTDTHRHTDTQHAHCFSSLLLCFFGFFILCFSLL